MAVAEVLTGKKNFVASMIFAVAFDYLIFRLIKRSRQRDIELL